MLEVKKEKHEKLMVFKLEGTLDLDGAQTLKSMMQETRQQGTVYIILDFTEVKSVVSSVLTILLTPLRAITIMGGKVAFCCMTPSIHKVIKTAPFYESINVFATREDALEAYEQAES